MRKYIIIHFLITSIVLSIGIPSYLILSNISEDTTHVLVDADSEENAEEFELEIVQFKNVFPFFKQVEFSGETIYVFRYFSSIDVTLESPPPEL
ncbi:hypothetical protein [Tenacibaculum sp. SG-28]|uniref:hypothetical protein n=1 Tax=Tenacibaculum sp. SG-28 TaxID=754426 RepID=UPI000CF3FF21|nr:hypothetical protein [Tenacibaculum sp. SG-28]PQJ21678.1 hypothetical protein BSU00_06215 [Tenacibaculum sp. SG-28]